MTRPWKYAFLIADLSVNRKSGDGWTDQKVKAWLYIAFTVYDMGGVHWGTDLAFDFIAQVEMYLIYLNFSEAGLYFF